MQVTCDTTLADQVKPFLIKPLKIKILINTPRKDVKMGDPLLL